MFYRILEKINKSDYSKFHAQVWFGVWLNINCNGKLAIFDGNVINHDINVDNALGSINLFKKKGKRIIHKVEISKNK